jgi:hypothetical protein
VHKIPFVPVQTGPEYAPGRSFLLQGCGISPSSFRYLLLDVVIYQRMKYKKNGDFLSMRTKRDLEKIR